MSGTVSLLASKAAFVNDAAILSITGCIPISMIFQVLSLSDATISSPYDGPRYAALVIDNAASLDMLETEIISHTQNQAFLSLLLGVYRLPRSHCVERHVRCSTPSSGQSWPSGPRSRLRQKRKFLLPFRVWESSTWPDPPFSAVLI